MTTWVIVSWVFVAILTGINIFLFIKLKNASEQMMKMAFPGASNMNEAMSHMQSMMKSMKGRSGNPFAGGRGPNANDPQLRKAMEMLKRLQK